MKKSLKASIFLIFLLISVSGYCQFRKYSNEFLNIGAGARGLAMGSAQVASVKDASSGYWNPAGLTSIVNIPEATLMHAEYFSGIAKYDFGSVAIPIKEKKSTIGFSLLRFAVDDIPNTLYLVEPDGSINYNNVQKFSSADYAFLFSYSKKLKDITEDGMNLSFGANAKIIYRKVGKFANAWGFGLDAGAMLSKKKWRLGVMARDITTTFNAWSFHFTEKEKEVFYLTNNDIPIKSTEITAPRLVLAGGYDFKISKTVNLLAEANMSLTFDGKRNTIFSGNTISADPSIGLEASIKNSFFVRAGITNFQKALSDGDTVNQKKVWIYQPSIGAGFKVKNVTIDYAFSNLANQSNPLFTHVVSLSVILAKRVKE